MPVSAFRTVTTSRNGVGAFILQCKRLDFHYCDWAGSSRGMNKLLTSAAPSTSASTSTSSSTSASTSTPTPPETSSSSLLHQRITSKYPSTEFRISPRPHKHPVLLAHYINGNIKAVCVRNLEPEQIIQKAELLLQNSGTKNKKIRGKNVVSSNESVRGIWSPMHAKYQNI